MSFDTAVLEEVKGIKTESEKNKNKYFGATPLNITQAIKKIGEQSDLSEALEMVAELNKITPDWAEITGAITDDEVTGKKRISVKAYFDYVKAGNIIMEQFHLLRFPKALEGATYNKETGAWRYLGKNEVIMIVEKTIIEEVELWGFYQQAEKRISYVSRYVKQKTYDPSFFNRNPFDESAPELVVFKNGTYNILTNEMKPNDPKDYILTSFNYDLDMSGKATPYSDKFFSSFFGDSALFMKQYIGYMFYRSYAPAPDMVFLYGAGGEGKSSFLNMVKDNYINSENISALTPDQLTTERFSIIDLLGKSANICGDIDASFITATAILKRLTGSDFVKGEAKGIQAINFISYAKLFFSMNEFFHFKDMSTGFASRLTIVPITIGDQRLEDATFWQNHNTELIKEESSAFAYTCIREFRKVFDGKRVLFTKSASMQKAKTEWLYDNDRIAQFLDESAEITLGDDRGEIGATVYQEYKEFCKINGFTPKSAKELTNYLARLGVVKTKSFKDYNDGGTRTQRFIGLKLTTSYINPAYRPEYD